MVEAAKSPNCSFCDSPPAEGRGVQVLGRTGLRICDTCIGSPPTKPPHATATSCSSCGYIHYHLREAVSSPGTHVCEHCISNLQSPYTDKADKRCSFCRKPDTAVLKLMPGQSIGQHIVYICNECVQGFAAAL